MGLFSGILKVVGGVAKAGLSSLTHGLSDKALKLLKGRGVPKAAPQAQQTLQAETLLKKIGVPQPKLSSTERSAPGEGWNFQTRYDRQVRARTRPRRAAARLYRPDPDQGDPDQLQRPAPGRRAPAKARTGAKRTVPRGGLDLPRIAAMWRAEGKPGQWSAYIKAHTDVRKQ